MSRHDLGNGLAVEVDVAQVEGRWQVVGLKVDRSGQPIRSGDLRSIQMGDLLRAELGIPPRGPRRRISDEKLAQVAEVYRSALTSGQPARTAVMQSCGARSDSTAAKWIMEARKRGFLGATAPRTKGENTPPARPTELDRSHFEAVANVYSQAWQAGQDPTVAVAEHWHVPRRTAARWVQRARYEHNLLPPTEKFKPRAKLQRIDHEPGEAAVTQYVGDALYDEATGPNPPPTRRPVPDEWDDPTRVAVDVRAFNRLRRRTIQRRRIEPTNAKDDDGHFVWILRKPSPRSSLKIDAAMAAVLSTCGPATPPWNT